MLTDEDLKGYNAQGLLAGDSESDDAFEKRVRALVNPEGALGASSLPPSSPLFFDLEDFSNRYGLAPDWVRVYYSNRGLRLWEGASMWLFETGDGLRYPVLQFRPSAQEKKQFLGYAYREIYEHEALHAVRSPLKSIKFEEMIAYSSSPSPFRRWFGAAFQTPSESLLYVITWLITLISSALLVLTGISFFLALFATSLLLSLGITVYGICRLIWRHKQMGSAKRIIKAIFPTVNPDAIMVRLSDNDILSFVNGEEGAIKEELKGRSIDSLRWRQILASYPLG